MTITATVARFASRLNISDIPSNIVFKTKLHLLDAVGCGWAASRSTFGEQARLLAKVTGGLGNASIFGGPSNFSPAAAAFANAFIINALDHDDGVEIEGKGMGHPGASLVAAAMAALDSHPGKISETDLIAALVAGFEINNRLIHALQPSAESFQKAYGVAQHQAIGAAVVYGRACGFDEELMHNAIGFAATMTNVPSLHKYNWQQRPIAALKDGVAPAAQAGVQAALMAHAGLSGSRDVLDGPQGFWRMVGSDQFDPCLLGNGLGQEWYVRYGSFKRYPACRWLATAIECAETLVEAHHWAPDDIALIRVRTFSRLAADFMVVHPKTPTDAQFSLPYTLAAILLGIPAVEWYAEKHMRSPKLQRLAEKVTVEVDEELDRRWLSADRQPGSCVQLVNRAGDAIQHSLATPYGSAARPMQTLEIIAKARQNLEGSTEAADDFIRGFLEETILNSSYEGAKALITPVGRRALCA